MGEKEGQVDKTGLQWLVRWPRMPGWSEQDDQELRWNQALMLCTELDKASFRLLAREALRCPLVKEAAWLASFIEDALKIGDKDDWVRILHARREQWRDSDEENDNEAMAANPMHASGLFLESIAANLLCFDDEIDLIRRAAQLGHPLATVKYPTWLAMNIAELGDSDEEGFDHERRDKQMSELKSACAALQRTYETFPSCRPDAMLAAKSIFSDTNNIDRGWLRFFDDDEDDDEQHVFRATTWNIAFGSIIEVHFLIRYEMTTVLDWSWDAIPEVACTLLRAFSVFGREDARALVFKLCDSAVRGRIGEQLLLRFVDGIRACPEALDWYLSPFDQTPYWMASDDSQENARGVWYLTRAFLDQQREQVVAWCLCAKRLRVSKDVRRMIAMMLWNDRLNLSDDVGSILEPTTWKQAPPPPTKKSKK